MRYLDFNAGSNLGLTAEQIADDYRLSTISTMTNDTAHKSIGSTISSTSLTRVSDISDEPKITEKADAISNSQVSVKEATSGQISTTDVILEVSSDTKPPLLPISPVPHPSHSDDDSPPPLPSSEPPDLDEDTGTLNSELQSSKKLNILLVQELIKFYNESNWYIPLIHSKFFIYQSTAQL